MKYRKLTEDGDMTFGNGDADFYVDSPEGVAQSVMTRLRLWVGEWFLDTSEGTPYSQSALGTNKRETIGPAIRERILLTEHVDSIESFEILTNAIDRTTSIKAIINTDFGPAELEGIL